MSYKSNTSYQSYSLSGFTLIEILVVLSIFAILGTLGLMVSMETFRGSSFRSERDLVVSVLQKARSRAQNNICLGVCSSNDGQKHGVHFTLGQYIIFQGQSYALRDLSVDQNIPINNPVAFNPNLPADVIFNQLDGTLSSAVSFTINDISGHTSQININTEGQITWTN